MGQGAQEEEMLLRRGGGQEERDVGDQGQVDYGDTGVSKEGPAEDYADGGVNLTPTSTDPCCYSHAHT